MKKNLLTLAAVLTFFLAAFFVFGMALDGLIAYSVYTTGKFHGIAMHLPQVLRATLWSLGLFTVSLALGFLLARSASRA